MAVFGGKVNEDLTDGLLSFLRIDGQQSEYSLLINLDIKATSNLSKVDYNDDIKLEIDVGKGLEFIFGGKIKQVDFLENDQLGITSQGHIYTLEETIMPGLAMRISGADENINYVLRYSGWPADKISINGLKIVDKKRFCVILSPIANIGVDKSFGIGDVNFTVLEQEYKDVLSSLNAESFPNFPKLDEEIIWAHVFVVAPHFYDAQISGIEKINMALSLLSDVRMNSRPFYFSNGEYMPVFWQRKDRFSRVTREPWVFIQDIQTKECLLANTDSIKTTNKLEIAHSLRNLLEIGTDKLQVLFQKKWEDLSKKEKGLVHALQWLHQAREEGTNVDKLFYLWNAIEFISAATKQANLFSKEETKKLKELTHNTISSNDQEKSSKDKRLDEIFNTLNAPPLLSKLKQITELENVDISEEEWEQVRISRRKRNDIIHGRSNIVFSDDEAIKLSFIVSKIIYGVSLNL